MVDKVESIAGLYIEKARIKHAAQNDGADHLVVAMRGMMNAVALRAALQPKEPEHG